MVVMLAMMAAAVAFLVVMMMVMVVMLLLHQVLGGNILTFHCLHNLAARQLAPGSGDQRSMGIMLPEHGHCHIQLCLRNGIGTGQNDSRSGFHLIVVELTEVLHVDLYLAGIHHSHGVAQHHIFTGDLFHRGNNIRQLANTGGLDHNTVRMIALDDLCQRLTEIAHQTAANAAGVHLGNVDACILQETAINSDLTEFILDEHQLLAAVGFLNHLFDQGGFAGSKEAGININNSHSKHLLFQISAILYHQYSGFTRIISSTAIVNKYNYAIIYLVLPVNYRKKVFL